MTNERKQEVLKAIVKHFVETAEPVGSNTIIVRYNFQVSPATIRNDMASLEDEGLIFQPHTSSGRVPTDSGYRKYIEEIADIEKAREKAITVLHDLQAEQESHKAKEYLHDGVQLLSKATGSASFATVPDSKRTFYLGLSNVLRQPEFLQDAMQASQVLEVFEKSDNFLTILNSLDLEDKARAFIGEENILPQTQSCSIVVAKYHIHGFDGYIGLLGPKRMDYPFNIAMVEQVKTLLEQK